MTDRPRRSDRSAPDKPSADPPLRPDVPDAWARWQSADELAAAIEASGLSAAVYPHAYPEREPVPVAAAVAEATATARTYPALRAPDRWRVAALAVHGQRPHATVYLTLQGGVTDHPGETVAVQLVARR